MKKALMFILMMLVVTVFLTSCDFGKPPINNNGGEDDDTWKNIDSANETEVYTTLLAGAFGSLDELSTKRINASYPLVSVDTRLKVEFNDYLLWFEIKLNYDYNDPESMKFSAEMINAQNEDIVLGIYFSENNLYLQVMNGDSGKIKLPLENSVFKDLLPLEYDNMDISKLAIFLNTVIATNGNITGQTRKNGTENECKYTINIDLPQTLKGIMNSLDEDFLDGVDAEKISTIIQKIVGVTVDDILNNDLPECNMQIKFSTLGVKLTSFETNINVDQEDNPNTMFGGEMINLSVNLDKLVIDKSFISIPFFGVNEYKSYPEYFNQSFRVDLNVKQKGDTSEEDIDYLLRSEFKLDLDDIGNNQLKFEVLDEQNAPVTGVYVYDSMFYYYQYNSETEAYEKKIEFEIDVADIYNKIKDGVEITVPTDPENSDEPAETQKETSVLEYVAYFVGAVKILEDKISLTITEDFYTTVLPGIEHFLLYADEVIDEDLQSMPESQYITDAVEFIMSNTFEIFIDVSEDAESFITIMDDDIVFPEGVDGSTETEE